MLQNKLLEYIRTAGRIGFTAIEVSDGTIEMSPEVRASAISEARNLGLKVLTEVGKRYPVTKYLLPAILNESSKTWLRAPAR